MKRNHNTIYCFLFVRYSRAYLRAALRAVVLHRIALRRSEHIEWFRIFGTGKNRGFGPRPDWLQWSTLVSLADEQSRTLALKQMTTASSHGDPIPMIMGPEIADWYRTYQCEVKVVVMRPIRGHGSWSGKRYESLFRDVPPTAAADTPRAVITRAAIRPTRIRSFMRQAMKTEEQLKHAPGLLFSTSFGELPLILQGTFTIWESDEAMKAFAYGSGMHRETVRQSNKERWLRESMFARFEVLYMKDLKYSDNPV